MRNFEQVLKAVQVATAAHHGQMRKGIDEPFIAHPIRVAMAAEAAGLDANVIAAALLHDVIEDTPMTRDDLIRLGFHGETVALVDVLTKWWGDEFVLTPGSTTFTARRSDYDYTKRIKEEFKPAYYAKIAAEPAAVALKLLDRADNLHDMVKALPNQRAWAKRYLQKTREEISPLAALSVPEVSERFHEALWALDKALTVLGMEDGIRPLAEGAV